MKWRFLILIITLSFPHYNYAQQNPLLDELSRVIDEREVYIQEKYNRINLLQRKLAQKEPISANEQFLLIDDLVNEYRSFNFDSAFVYAIQLQHIARELGERNSVAHSQLQMIFILQSGGLYKETFDSLNAVRTQELTDSLKLKFYEQSARAYYELAAYNSDLYYADRHGKTGDQYVDSALMMAGPSGWDYLMLNGLKEEANGFMESAKGYYEKMIEDFDLSDHQYAMVAYSLGNIYRHLGMHEKGKEMIIRSAIADFRSSTKETVALMELSRILFSEGELEKSYQYINQAARDAVFYGSRRRILQVSTILPKIEAAKLATVEYEKQRLMIIAISTLLFTLVIIGFTIIVYNQYRQLDLARKNLAGANEKLQEVNHHLMEANKIKEEYIAHSFRKDSDYIEKIERFIKSIDRKLMDRRYGEISQTLTSINLKKERESLFKNFDEIFLRLFPNFLPEFNKFFEPAHQYELKVDHALPTEIRIFALIRLGIHEHEQIANILEYSVRTVYNYKNKVKSKSILSNDEFEEKVMGIKAF